MEPRIQYAKTADGVSIGYWTLGQGGEPLLIMSPLAVSHIALEWRFASLRSWYEHLASSRMMIRYDPRCSGMSQRGVADLSPGARLSDIDAVVGSLGLESFGVIAGYASGRFGIAYAAYHPQRVSRLGTWCEGMPSAEARRLASPAMLSLAEEDWQAYIETFSHRLFGWSKGKDAHEWATLVRESNTREDAMRNLASIFGFDFRNRLAEVRSPTLILHHAGYRQVKPSEATDLAAGIPGSQLVMIPGRFEPLYECGAAMDAIDEFFGITPRSAASSGASPPSSGTAIILFADIVDSTALTERLGDTAFRDKARGLDEAMRGAIRDNGGMPVEGKTLGDGVLAVFTSAKQAITCARACHKAAGAAGLSLHAGIHAGDVIREADNVYGGAVNIAARVAAASAAGETLVSGTVRDLARTSAGVSFEDPRAGAEGDRGAGASVGSCEAGVMEPRIRYVKSADGTRIAMSTLGRGRPLIAVFEVWLSSMDSYWQVPEVRNGLERLARGRTVVRFDHRGVGLSEREVGDLSLDARVSDLAAVIDQLGSAEVDLLGTVSGGPIVIGYAAQNPTRVRRLTLWDALARVPDIQRPAHQRALWPLIESDWELYVRTQSLAAAGWTETGLRMAQTNIENITTQSFLAASRAQADYDVTELLNDVRCPTLVMHRRGHEYVSFDVAKRLAAFLPNARLVQFDQEHPLVFGGEGVQLIEQFLDEDEDDSLGEQLPSGTAIILFADIVDSTALTERMGDTAFRDKARGLDEAMRAAIRANGGTAVEGKTLGDGVLAVFTSAKQAIACARACHDAAGAAGLSLHAGIHAGDVIREADNVYGGAVNIASRIAAASAAGETLVSGTVRDLARTSAGVAFEDRGKQALKGVGEAVRVWAVRQA